MRGYGRWMVRGTVRASCVVLCLAWLGRAQGATGPDLAVLKERAAHRFPQTVTVGALGHRLVIEPSNHQGGLGHVAGVVRTAAGDINILLNYGGFFGLGSHVIAVPVEATGLLGQFLEVLDLDTCELDALPDWKPGDGVALSDSETIRIGLTKN